MKNGILDRIMIFIYVLITSVLAVITALRAFGVDLVQSLFDGLSVNAPGLLWKLIVVGLVAIVVLLGVYTVVIITPSRRKKSNFITIIGDDSGEVKVALPALRDMVKQAISAIDGLSEVKIDVADAGDAVTVSIVTEVDGKVHVPTMTANIQHAVRTHVQSNCGVAVKSVSVVVNSIVPSAEVAAPSIVATQEAAAFDKEPTINLEDNPSQADIVPVEVDSETGESALESEADYIPSAEAEISEDGVEFTQTSEEENREA